MAELIVLLAFLLGLAAGAVAMRFKGQASIARIEERAGRVAPLEASLAAMEEELRQRAGREASLEKELELSQLAADEKLEQLRTAREQLKAEFKELAADILTEKEKHMNETGKKQLQELLDPVRKNIDEFRQRVDQVHTEDTKQRSTLTEQMRQFKELHRQMSQDAQDLTKALKGDAKMRGNWGEMILERVLEASGLSKGREFDREVTLTNAAGERYRPDAVIHLPEGKDVIVDAKVSLVAYEQFSSSSDEVVQAQAIKAHLASIRTHLKQLAEKRYDDLDGIQSLDMVLMFVPIEPALMVAWQHDPSLFTEAFERRVFLVSPSTLFAVLRVVQNLWRYDDRNKHAQEIAQRAGALYNKVASFVESLQKVGDRIAAAQKSYNEAEKQLSTGAGNVIRQTQMLQELGAKTSKQLPTSLVEASEE